MDQLCQKINNPVLNIDQSVYGAFRVIIQRCLQSQPHRRIKLEAILKHTEVKNHLKGYNFQHKNIHQIDKIPKNTIEWNNIINEVPNNFPKTSENKQKSIKRLNREFMHNYSKDSLIQLNGRLIDMIIERNHEIEKLQNELKQLKELKIEL